MVIQDDGAGFDPNQSAGDGHYGLRFMRERAEQIGGQLLVESEPGAGTRILFTVHCFVESR
jgi:two-component system nitrate/nitrite sensor histidine kinase NarX